jgi:hypothetical protein
VKSRDLFSHLKQKRRGIQRGAREVIMGSPLLLGRDSLNYVQVQTLELGHLDRGGRSSEGTQPCRALFV